MGKTIAFLLLLSSLGSAQALTPWGKVDTLTSGDFDDRNPQLDHGGLGTWQFGNRFEWLIFERWDGNQSSICASRVKPLTGSTVSWDTSIVTISPMSANVIQQYPDICTNFETLYRDSAWLYNVPTTVAAWETVDTTSGVDSLKRTICYSYTSEDEKQWSSPQILTQDGEGVKVRSLSDSSIILIWRAGSVIMFSVFMNDQVSSPDTLLITNYDSAEFDFEGSSENYPYPPRITSTMIDSSGKVQCIVAGVSSLDPVVFSQIDTINSAGKISNPGFINYWFANAMMLNVSNGDRIGSYMAFESYGGSGIWQLEELASDPSSDNVNAVGTTFPPIIIDLAQPARKVDSFQSLPWLELYAWERQSESDTSLVFGSHLVLDTIASIGYNRKVSLGTYDFWQDMYDTYPCVWESNRTGRSHIYGRVGAILINAIQTSPLPEESFNLYQNYPNPFNPTTTISYRLSAASHVTLTVFDILGRKVKTLVDARQLPGEHSAMFDARGLASGMYLCRLIAGGHASTIKLILIK